jgi:hypothetical protein
MKQTNEASKASLVYEIPTVLSVLVSVLILATPLGFFYKDNPRCSRYSA